MRIDGITCCVGEEYSSYLRRTLPVWLDTLDSLTIVTDTAALATWLWATTATIDARVRFCVTDAFTANGALFNKGAALNEGLRHSKPNDWALSLDCDVMPPKNWRRIAERRGRRDSINGCRRHSVNRRPAPNTRFIAKGYFQLWHTSDPTYRRSPIFDEHFIDAAGYDSAFADQWPRGRHHDLGFSVAHLGERSKNWCGPGTTAEQQEAALERWRERRAARCVGPLCSCTGDPPIVVGPSAG